MNLDIRRPPVRQLAAKRKLGTLLAALILGCALATGEPASAQTAAPAPTSGQGGKASSQSKLKAAAKGPAKSAADRTAKRSAKRTAKRTAKEAAKGAGKAAKAGKKVTAANRKPPRAAPPSALAPPASTVAPTVADCHAAEHANTLRALPPGAATEHAQAVAFDRNWVRWPSAADNPPAADGRYVLVSDGQPLAVGQPLSLARVVASLPRALAPLPATLTQSQPHVAPGVDLQMPTPAQLRWPALLRGPLQLVETDGAGVVRRHTGLQVGALLDDLFGTPAASATLGAVPSSRATTFAVWAPTAQRVNVCLHAPGSGTQAAQANAVNAGTAANAVHAGHAQLLTLRRDDDSGIWRGQWPADLSGHSYTLLVDVHAPGTGMVRNKVTDPYSLSLTTNSQRSWIGNLDQPQAKPAGWNTAPRPSKPMANTDLVVYELNVRDFSVSDDSVPPAQRGKYGAFTEGNSIGMRHLRTLAAAGVTDLHLLPVFDFATVPERGCMTPQISGKPDGKDQQAAVTAQARNDCNNWGHDPLHFGAPEGSYASDAEDGAVRVREFRAMVMAVHAAGLRVGMDMVYNYTSASGQAAQSVLDRIVPGYYRRLTAQGAVETSTCCANTATATATATERIMMAKLMADTAAIWARDYRIDSMRFGLMGHQPRAAMEQLQAAVDRAAGRRIHLLGEVVNDVENHDNATLFDINLLKLPLDTPPAERARVQVLGLADTLLAQGVPYIHAGVEILRSKRLERHSYDSGDRANRLDRTLQTHHFGTGLPHKAENAALWPLMQPLLAQVAAIQPQPADIRFTRDAFIDLLKIRASSSLFRLRTAADVAQRLTQHNTGPQQEPTVVVVQLEGRGLPGAKFAEVLYALNASPQAQAVALPALRGRAYTLHPVHSAATAADPRPAAAARWQARDGTLLVPPRTAVVYVVEAP